MTFDRKEYQRQYARKWAKDNPEKHREKGRKSYAKRMQDPEYARKARSAHLVKRYGITIEQQDQMFEFQTGLCAICTKPLTQKNMNVDHDHHTGAVRGLLCHRCNMVLASFETTPHRLAMESYIADPPAPKVLG